MTTFRILYLRDNVLESSEMVEATDVLAAAKKVSGTRPDATVEIWSDTGKAAVLRPSSSYTKPATLNQAAPVR